MSNLKWKFKEKIFSGDDSREMWKAINTAKTVAELKVALYTVCCQLQISEQRVLQEEKKYKWRLLIQILMWLMLLLLLGRLFQ